MKPKTVLVETNWVVDIAAPAHLQSPQAAHLLQRADAGEFQLFVPAVCLAEARETIPRRFATRTRSKDLRKFVRWARDKGKVTSGDASSAFRVLNQFDELVADEIGKATERIDELKRHSGLTVFPLSEQMLERQVTIGAMNLSLKPYDLAILAAVLVMAEELQKKGYAWSGFCELDSDLQPYDRTGDIKPTLYRLYSEARIRVYGDFLLESDEGIPDEWLIPS